MTLTVFDLKELLNYDTHTRQFLSYTERILLHRAISKQMNGFGFVLTQEITRKIKEVKSRQKQTNWAPVEGFYTEDRKTATIKFIILD